MATPTVTDYLKYANLQMATEAFIRDERTGILAATPQGVADALKAGNNRSLLFTQTQAEAFTDPAKGWTVLDQKANTTTGFSGTLFKNSQTGELVLSFRSTEFIDDAARDNKATNELEIAEGGFALGQIADMEAWYAELSKAGGALVGKTYSVTGYSLGAHLATVFNLLRQDELQQGPPPAVLADVITFNGAGIGRVGNGSLAGMVQRFKDLRAQSATPDGLANLFITTKGKEIYAQLRVDFLAGNRVLTTAMRDKVATAFGANVDENSLLKADYDLLLGPTGAIFRALAIQQVAKDVPLLSSGNGSASPKTVVDKDILAEDFDYQLAVMTTRKEFNTQARSLLAGSAELLFTGGLAKLPGTPVLANQYDAVGWEYSADTPVAVVAHSLWHHGTDVKLFIEDQPNWRGGIGLASLSASLAAVDVRLLVNGFSAKNFGDDHSLALIVDSLNMQNILLQLVPGADPSGAASTLDAIRIAKSSVKSRRWRHGDLVTTPPINDRTWRQAA